MVRLPDRRLSPDGRDIDRKWHSGLLPSSLDVWANDASIAMSSQTLRANVG